MAVPHDGPVPAPGMPAQLVTEAELAAGLATLETSVGADAAALEAALDARLDTLETDVPAAEANITALLADVSTLQAAGWLSAADYGAVGDGTTDDTAALQAALNALAGAGAGSGLIIPAGTYKITSALSIPLMQHQTIIGAGWQITKIVQHTDNIPVIKTGAELIHSIRLSGLTLSYNAVQPAANTNAIALNFTLGSAGTGQGWFYWKVDRLVIEKANVGIGIGGTGASGLLAVWNCSFEQIVMNRISMSMVKLVSPTTIGMPVNTFRNLTHVNNGGVPPQGPAIQATAAELQFDGLDIEDWYNRIILLAGGSSVSIRGLHTERHTLNSTNSMFEVANGPLSIEGGEIAFEVTSTANAKLFTIDTGGSLRVTTSRINAVLTSGTITGLTNGVGAQYQFSAISDVNGNVPLPSAPMGVLGYAEVTANQGTFTAETDLTGLSVTVTVPAGRRIRITGDVEMQSTVVGDSVSIRIKEGATVLNERRPTVNVGSWPIPVHVEAIETPSAGSHTYKLAGVRANGTGNVTMRASATQVAFILVEDLGAA